MLHVIVPDVEFWDEKNSIFLNSKGFNFVLEHSLLSISKWEMKWKKPFISDKEKTTEEMLDYIRCMTITQNIDINEYKKLTRENIKQIEEYISDSHTATWFNEANKDSENKKENKKEQITSELIYYWMTASQIPFECEKWNFNRLMVLIRICSIKNQPPKKRGKKDVMKQNSSLNAARRNKMGSRG